MSHSFILYLVPALCRAVCLVLLEQKSEPGFVLKERREYWLPEPGKGVWAREGGNGKRRKDPNLRNSIPGKRECVPKRGS